MQSPHRVKGLVGREEELDALITLLDDPELLPALAVVAGDAGIGKTALWLAAVEAAAAGGYLTLTCRPTEAEAGYAFAGLVDLIGGVAGEALSDLPGPQRQALEAALGRAEAAGPIDDRLVAFGFLSALKKLAEERPLLLGVDDLQWLDTPSLGLVRYALPRFGGGRIAAVTSVRGSVPLWLSRLERVRELELGPLSVGALHELLRARFEVSFPRPVLLRIWETSGGNPFFALELARALQRRGAPIEPGAELPVPATLEGLVVERLQTLSPDADEVCRVVAASADPTIELVELALNNPVGGVQDALEARVLELDGERLRFTHPLLASAISARTVGARRRSLHKRLAALASDPEEQARHLALAASAPSARVAEALDAAARHARARGSASAAAELAERAVALTPPRDEEGRRQRRLQAADLHFEAGDLERALAIVRAAGDDAPRGSARAAVLLRLGRLRAETSGAAEAVALWREALAEADGDAALEARILFDLGQFLRFAEGTEPALAHLEAAIDAAERVGDEELTCRASAAYALVHFNSGRGIAREANDRALALEAALEGGPTTLATPFLVHQLVWSGDLARARDVLARLRAWSDPREESNTAEMTWYLALLEWRAGNWDAAAAAANEAVTITQQFGRESSTITLWPSAVIAAHRGEITPAREMAERGLAVVGRPGVAEAGYEWVLGFIALAVDDAVGSLQYLARADRILADLGIREPALLWHVPDLLDALVAEGDVERIEATLAPWEERAHALDRAWALAIAARTRALLAANRGDVDEAFAGFERAIAAHARVDDPFQRARTLLALGATQRRTKQRRAARDTLEQATALFAGLPAPLWVVKAKGELARIGGRAPSRGELTPSERRIAALVAEGRSNREVAAALFLTEHTVETALTRIYRKLGVRSRSALAHRLSPKS
jgi:DNA-binding CsgD family transcriptional regulator/tetratricopeptide (TPR) repeat protein